VQRYYYLYNAHGDVTALIDASGNIAATYDYDAFGNILHETGTANNNIKFAGYQYDTDTGLYYLNARYYDSTIARFITEDTYRGEKNDPLSLNLYTYCHNEPIQYVDPSGHSEVVINLANQDYSYLGPYGTLVKVVFIIVAIVVVDDYAEKNMPEVPTKQVRPSPKIKESSKVDANKAREAIKDKPKKAESKVDTKPGESTTSSTPPSGGNNKNDKNKKDNNGNNTKTVKPESAVSGSKKHGVNWKEGPARAKATGNPQGQWAKSDLAYATKMANTLKPGESAYFELPKGAQSVVHMPDGTTQIATRMWIRNNGTGTWHGYPMP
jgi:RHS repeat-associated protein